VLNKELLTYLLMFLVLQILRFGLVNTSVDNLQRFFFHAIHLWFSQNGLVINPDKSEAIIWRRTRRRRKKFITRTYKLLVGYSHESEKRAVTRWPDGVCMSWAMRWDLRWRLKLY